MTTTPSFKATIDVRHIIPRERHPLIFNTFDHLEAGEAVSYTHLTLPTNREV